MAGKPKPISGPLHALPAGQVADFFALLADKHRGTTRDGSPYYQCRFRDAKRAVVAMIWADSPSFADCDQHWAAGQFFKIRGTLVEHERYGLQVEVHQIREVRDADRADGFAEADYYDRSRFDSDAMLAELRGLAEAEVADPPLRTLVVGLLDAHADVLKKLPASPRHYYPFPGGWLEHTLSVTRNCVFLADRYAERFPDLKPPLNRDLIVAAAVLHEIGRAVELTPGPPGQPPEATVAGHLHGHVLLGRDLVRDAGRSAHDLHPDRLALLEHLILSHLTRPEWGSPRLPLVPEALVLHHADDLDAKVEMYARCLVRDTADGPVTDKDPVLGRQLLKRREV